MTSSAISDALAPARYVVGLLALHTAMTVVASAVLLFAAATFELLKS